MGKGAGKGGDGEKAYEGIVSNNVLNMRSVPAPLPPPQHPHRIAACLGARNPTEDAFP